MFGLTRYYSSSANDTEYDLAQLCSLLPIDFLLSIAQLVRRDDIKVVVSVLARKLMLQFAKVWGAI